MEDLEKLFDSCDSTYLRKVPVSKLILAVTNEINSFNNNEHQQDEKEEILMTVRNLLDPSNQDVQVDKATWLAAWHKQAESPSPKKPKVHTISDLAGGDDIGIGNSPEECQAALDVSKHSYCFSPASRSSSQEDLEELVLCKEEIQQLKCTLKTLNQQYQKLDDALLQEQVEKQELEKLKDAEVNRLTKQIKSLVASGEELKSTLDACEKEKLDLCRSFDSICVTERVLKTQVCEQNRLIAELNSEIEGISQEREYIKSHILELETKLEQQANVHREQVMEFQKTIQNCLDEKDELRSQITNTMLEKSKLSACWDELDCSGSNLQSELASFNFQSDSFLADSPSSLQKSLLIEMQAVKTDVETQTQEGLDFLFQTPPKKIDKCNQVARTPPKGIDKCSQVARTPPKGVDKCSQVARTPPKGVDKCSQVARTPPKGVDKCSQVARTPPKGVDKCSQVARTPPKGVDKCSQVEVELCPTETQTASNPFKVIQDPNLTNDMGDTFCQKPPLAGATDIFNEPPDRTSCVSNELINAHHIKGQGQSLICHAETQTHGVSYDTLQTLPKKVDMCNQAGVQMYPVATQTSPFKINVESNLASDVADQFHQEHPSTCATDIFNNSSDLTLEVLNQPAHMSYNGKPNSLCDIQPYEKLPSKETSHIFNLQSDPNLRILHQQSNTKQVILQKQFLACDTPQLQQDLTFTVQIPPTKADKCNQVEAKMCPVETQTSPPAFENNDNSSKLRFSYLFVALACTVFFVLLIVSTIFCTGAILQIASDSGVLSFPYYGQTPEFVKRVMTPFVQVKVHRPIANNVPV